MTLPTDRNENREGVYPVTVPPWPVYQLQTPDVCTCVCCHSCEEDLPEVGVSLTCSSCRTTKQEEKGEDLGTQSEDGRDDRVEKGSKRNFSTIKEMIVFVEGDQGALGALPSVIPFSLLLYRFLRLDVVPRRLTP